MHFFGTLRPQKTKGFLTLNWVNSTPMQAVCSAEWGETPWFCGDLMNLTRQKVHQSS